MLRTNSRRLEREFGPDRLALVEPPGLNSGASNSPPEVSLDPGDRQRPSGSTNVIVNRPELVGDRFEDRERERDHPDDEVPPVPPPRRASGTVPAWLRVRCLAPGPGRSFHFLDMGSRSPLRSGVSRVRPMPGLEHRQGGRDPRPARVPAEDHQAIVEAGANPLAGRRHPERVDDLAHRVPVRLGVGVHGLLERRQVVTARPSASTSSSSARSIRDAVLLEPLLDRLGVVRERLGEEVAAEREDVREDLEPIAQRRDHGGDPLRGTRA